MVSTGGRAWVAVVALLLMLVAVVPSAAAAGTHSIDAPVDGDQADRSSLATAAGGVRPAQQTANNSTIQHTNPEENREDGNLDAVQRWLTTRMGETLINCTRRTTLSEEVACSRLNEAYPEWLSNYVTTARDTDGDGDDRRASQFNETRQTHEEYRDAVQQFRETRREYEAARKAGDRARARELARELSRAATRVNETAGTLTEQFAQLENSTGIEFGPAIRSARDVAANATAIATTVRQREFVDTTLVATANRTTIAFDAPVRLAGQLRTPNSSVANRTVRIAVGGRSYAVRTDAEGRFELTYRPVLLPRATESLRVAYRPAPRSLYERSETAVNVTVRGTAPSLSATLSEPTAVYGDTVRVAGRLRADGRGVPNVPLRVEFADSVRRVRTAPTGNYSAAIEIPAGVDDGSRSVSVGVAVRDRAIERTNETSTLRVRSSSTELRLRAEEVTPDRALITAVLVTESGRAVGGEPLRLRTANGSGRTVTTGADGAATAALDLTNRTGNVTVVAAYSPSGGNLESSRARLRIAVPEEASAADEPRTDGGDDGAGEGSGGLFPETGSTPWLVALAAVGFVAAGGAVVAARVYGVRPEDVLARLPVGALGPLGTDPAQADAAAENEDGTAEGTAESTATAGDGTAAGADTSVVEDAESLLAAGRTDDAVITIYEAVRAELVDRYELLPGVTHWELLDRLRGHDGERVDESVVGLTTAYEQAAYAPDAVEADEATAAVETAERLLSETDQFL